jgi:hypothetical protein
MHFVDGWGANFMGTGDAFRMFLIEYKKRLPDIPENKEFIEMMDYMTNEYFGSHEITYLDQWDDWISPKDKRYWRNPTPEETKQILLRQQKKKKTSFFGYLLGKGE